jgi:hypothetical protein
MKTYTVTEGRTVLMTFRADFRQASSPILIGDEAGKQFSGTPLQVADARHSPVAAAKLLNEWLRNNGGQCWERGTAGLHIHGSR